MKSIGGESLEQRAWCSPHSRRYDGVSLKSEIIREGRDEARTGNAGRGSPRGRFCALRLQQHRDPLLSGSGRHLMLNGSTYLRNGAPQLSAMALRNAAPCATHPSSSKTSTSSVGREKTIGTTAAPSTPSLGWRESSQPSSPLGGKCHEALWTTAVENSASLSIANGVGVFASSPAKKLTSAARVSMFEDDGSRTAARRLPSPQF